jgi:acyl-CoA synthetase (AMP-forming)/AMP-acid ligase II
MITHYGLIFNSMQLATFESPHRKPGQADIVTGVVPFSHGYGIGLTHIMVWRGDMMVVFPRFDMQLMLQSVQQYRINRLYIVRQLLCVLLLFQLITPRLVPPEVQSVYSLTRV